MGERKALLLVPATPRNVMMILFLKAQAAIRRFGRYGKIVLLGGRNYLDIMGKIFESNGIDVPLSGCKRASVIALVNGLIRQQVRKMDSLNGVKDAAVAFCRRSLLKQ